MKVNDLVTFPCSCLHTQRVQTDAPHTAERDVQLQGTPFGVVGLTRQTIDLWVAEILFDQLGGLSAI